MPEHDVQMVTQSTVLSCPIYEYTYNSGNIIEMSGWTVEFLVVDLKRQILISIRKKLCSSGQEKY